MEELLNKLIELLNEYEKEAVVHWYEWYGKDVLMCRYIKDNFVYYTDEASTLAISKYYGFIKRLVDNDKVDENKIDDLKLIPTLTYQNMIDDCDCGKSHWHPYTFAGYVDELLMLLAIQDKPIEFLISVLK